MFEQVILIWSYLVLILYVPRSIMMAIDYVNSSPLEQLAYTPDLGGYPAFFIVSFCFATVLNDIVARLLTYFH